MNNSTNINFSDVIVVGGGIAGLSTTAMLAKLNQSVILLESHNQVGGCAGYFRRGKFSFDVGATTLSGLSHNRSLYQFLQLLDLDLDLKFRHCDPSLIIHKDNISLKRFTDNHKWIEEQKKYFFHDWLEPLWNEIEKKSLDCWKLVKYSEHYPIRTFQDFKMLGIGELKLKIQSFLNLRKSFFKSYEFIKTDLDYKKIIDELLLISLQNKSENAPAFMSYMALTYLNDCWYFMGGMEGFVKLIHKIILQNNGQVFLNQKVSSVEKIKDFFLVKTNNQIYKCKKIISTLPIWNSNVIFQELKSSVLKKKCYSNPPVWGAITGYFVIKVKSEIKDLYHQVHLNKFFPYTHSHSIFISLCPMDDRDRTILDHQTVSISTHIEINHFEKMNGKLEMVDVKKIWQDEFCKQMINIFKDNIIDIKFFGIGDPKTFEKFTNRFLGSVGGIPHDVEKNIFNFPNYDTGVKNFFQIGDTTFPGQGIVGVVQGAMNLIKKI